MIKPNCSIQHTKTSQESGIEPHPFGSRGQQPFSINAA